MEARRLVGVICVAVIVASGCVPACGYLPVSVKRVPPEASRETTVTTSTALPPVEVREYKGQRLDDVESEPEQAINGPQHVDISSYRLRISGKVSRPLSLKYAEVTGMTSYEKATTLYCVEGWHTTYLWQGVRLKDLLEKAGYDRSAKVLIFRCQDGYSTSLPLDYIVSNDILLAYKMNALTMAPERGFPFQVVAEDRYGYKWAKWVTEIDVSNDTAFRGYWEQRGYDNGGELPAK